MASIAHGTQLKSVQKREKDGTGGAIMQPAQDRALFGELVHSLARRRSSISSRMFIDVIFLFIYLYASLP
jgi:hypothetical protein